MESPVRRSAGAFLGTTTPQGGCSASEATCRNVTNWFYGARRRRPVV
jgi:hypothetical protein